MSVREDCHWFDLELKLHNVKDVWDTVIEEDEQFYSYDGQLNSNVEKQANTQLIVSGPMIDVYLNELGNQILNKLSRGKTTGIVQTLPVLVPWQVMVHLMRMMKSYGGSVEGKVKRGSKEKVFTLTLSDSCCHKIWHIKRCKKKFLSKRRFTKDSTGKYMYNGCSKVVVSDKTPLTLCYKTKTQKMVSTFYIQRYDKDDIATDATLQSKLNPP